MDQAELMKDWYVRYNYIVGTRQTVKQKSRFLSSLLSDLKKIDREVHIHGFGDNNHGKNVYVGDIKNAKRIISTYYDTPIYQYGSYYLMDADLNKKNTIKTIIFQNLLFVTLGMLAAYFVGIPIYQAYDFLSVPAIAVTLFFLVYFILLKKISAGWPAKKNLIRNTSSLLVLLKFMHSTRDKDTAFAFLDYGAYDQAGLAELRKNSQGSIYYLDSIGANKELYQMSSDKNLLVPDDNVKEVEKSVTDHKQILFLTSMEKDKESYFLTKNAMKQKELNDKNMENAFEFLEKTKKKEIQ
ncbi:hypothetical protein [Lacticigenium naphthae]|uniref:hypothetical protein n=1 Tax=Lacticigenium naphthae TaxID=515351 RepID=UPI00041B4CE8|nr:hypothetical protein [Lacticigenium naphthae]